MKRALSLREISRHRAWLYGLAAMWILFFHMTFELPPHPALAPLRWLKVRGNCGADMFVLLSGMGLYLSLQRDGRILSFYRRRLERVFLPAFLVSAVCFGLQFTGTGEYLKKLTLLPYWLGTGSFWYAPFILTMYLIYPPIFRLQRRAPRAMWLLLAASLVLPFLTDALLPGWTRHCERSLTRIPAFLIGCMLAPHIDRNEGLPLRWIPVPLLAYILLSRTAIWPLWRYSGTALALFVLLLLTLAAPLFTRGALRRLVYRFFAFLGGISLELYLLQERIGAALAKLDVYASGRDSLFKLEIFNTIATIVLAALLHGLCLWLVRQLREVRIPESNHV